MNPLPPSWKTLFETEFQKKYFQDLQLFLKKEYEAGKTIYPKSKNIFQAFYLCPQEKVKVVIIGQDPYHGPHQAHGLSFSVPTGTKTPPSLKNIYKELSSDIGIDIPSHGNLEHWAQQGVLLLNATLTVEAASPNSHSKKGWEIFTDSIIQHISDSHKNVVFLLWGKYAQEKGSIIDQSKHSVLQAAHPSPFSAHNGFFGCKHFSQTNLYLEKHGKKPIKWET